ncbi:MAG: MFS transporter, partial [Nitriliruptorales bacterium]
MSAGASPGRLRRLLGLTGGASAAPLAVLFGLNLVDEFDRYAFFALTPEIRDAFGLSDTGIGAIAVVSGAFIVTAAIPMGFVSDRMNRVRLAGGAALLWGTMSVATGLVPAVVLLFVVRLLAGAGRVANEIVHPSLLTDYYDRDALPDVFKVHRLANPLGATSGIAAGFIAVQLSWEWAFFLLAIPTFLLLAGLTRLREPARGGTIDADLAVEAAQTGWIPLAEARRQLYAIRSLRRIWVSSFLIGTGAISIAQLLVLFFERVYAFGPQARGTVSFLYGAGVALGLLGGAIPANRAIAADREPRLASVTGLSGLVFAGGLWLTVASPWAVASAAAVVVVGVGAGGFQPAYYSLVGRVAPPRVRSQAYAWAILYVASGALFGLVFYAIGDAYSYRLSLALLGGVAAVAGLVARSARVFVDRDVAQAENALAAAVELRRELEQHGERALLTCRGVEVAYDRVQVLFGVDLEVRSGEIVALLGTNGAGKSTLLNAISGLVDPIGGAIHFDGRDISHADARQTARLGITQVPGGSAIFPSLSVQEHLRLAAWLERGDPDHVREATARVLDLFPRLAERRQNLAGDLSGGEQQMLAVGMAFIARPKLLMIDELSLGLAPALVEELLDVVRAVREEGTAVLVVEQSANVALTLAERAYFMEKGEVRFEGPTAELLQRDDLLRSVFLEGAAAVAGGNGQRAPTRVRESDATEEIVVLKPLLLADGLTKRFGGIRAVDGVDLTVHEGEILGIIGPNGAGKTTLFDLLSGFLAPDAGSVRLDGTDLTGASAHARARRGIGRSFQDARLVPSLSVAENLALGLERHLQWHDHLASALRLPDVVRLEEDVAWTVEDLVELMGLGACRDKLVRELSTGTRRIVDLAMAVAHDPRVLLLDEPSSGIAQRESEALGPLLARIQEETGCALVVIEHDVPLVSSIAERLLAMDLGRRIAEGRPEDVIRDERVVAAYLGGEAAAIRRSVALEEA